MHKRFRYLTELELRSLWTSYDQATEAGGAPTETADPHTALPRVIRLVIARDELPARRVDRMQMRPMRKRLRHALRHLAGLHLVITDRFPLDGEVDHRAGFLGGDVGGVGEKDERNESED